MSDPEGLPFGQAVGTGRYRRLCHPIPGICQSQSTGPRYKRVHEDFPLLVTLTMTYSEKVLVMAGSKIIDWAMGIMTKGELTRATLTWKQAHFSALMSGSLQLSHTDSKGNWEVGKEATPSQDPNPMASREFHLYDVW